MTPNDGSWRPAGVRQNSPAAPPPQFPGSRAFQGHEARSNPPPRRQQQLRVSDLQEQNAFLRAQG